MAFLPQALAHARPRLVLALVATLAAALVVVPLGAPAQAGRPHVQQASKAQKAHKAQGTRRAQKARQAHRLHQAKKLARQKNRHAHQRPRRPKKVVVPGQPAANYVMPEASYFSFPNRGKADRMVIRDRVLKTVKSVWGGRRTGIGTPLPTNGTIRMATWSFDDWSMAKALVAARDRGVSVQIVAALDANRGHASWRWLRKKLGQKLYRPHYPNTRETVSFARQCRGACRGWGGTAHSKYFLFDNVGAAHARKVVVQTSMNLTTMAFNGQWNEAQVLHSKTVYADYLAIFRQTRLSRQSLWPYHTADFGRVVDYFFPRPKSSPAGDPVMQNLNMVKCQFTVGGVVHHSQIRIIQYAIYGDRGVWIAKKLRYLWNAGCNVKFIYALASRPVLQIMRSHSGRGPIPMRQSVIKDSYGNVVKYNHSKWMTIVGVFGNWYSAAVVLNGSANWADIAFGDDEQMQRIFSRTETRRHLKAFAKTWGQKSSKPPRSARVVSFGRGVPTEVHEDAQLGKGAYKYLPLD